MGAGTGVFLIVHGAPVRGLELELMARAAFPITTHIITVSTPADAYRAFERLNIAAALLEETPDTLAFAAHAVGRKPGLAVGWIRNGAAGPPPHVGQRLNTPITQADLAALAQALNTDGNA